MTGYHQVPRQASFFQLNSELDPWVVKANNSINYAGWKAPISPPSLFDESQDYIQDSPPSSPPSIAAIKKNLIKAQQFISTASHVDPWTVVTDHDMLPPIVEDDISQNLYKTELCRSYMETNTCRYGVKCQFAHGRHELRPVMRHPKYKTEICKTFHTLGTCPYGIRCRFIHTRPIDTPDTSSSSTNSSTSSSPNDSPPSSPSRSNSPQQVLNWSTSWSSIERTLPPSPEAIVPDVDQPPQQPVEQPPQETKQPTRRLPIFRNLSASEL
eukprot:Phypoly_transcript_14055.p1 GENE.Phypoly_transcript_14055~~Phypoly_transcript_14055.p1  ORF type:complete len:297 (+),score=65.47 Phypoly_transcript_14055:87-893(+)